MPRKISFRGNTIVLNDEAADLKAGDRVRYIIHDWMEGEHTITGELMSVGSRYGDGNDIARVKVGAGLQEDVVQEVPVLALTVVAPVIQLKGDRCDGADRRTA